MLAVRLSFARISILAESNRLRSSQLMQEAELKKLFITTPHFKAINYVVPEKLLINNQAKPF
jgi:hypothetical protein